MVAILAGLIIFPACFAYGVSPDQGPSLVFVTLPVVFGQMPLGNVWGRLFFVFMAFASLSTVIAVFENLISWSMDKWGMIAQPRRDLQRRAGAGAFHPVRAGLQRAVGRYHPGESAISSPLRTSIVSNNMHAAWAALAFVLFCTTRRGWGRENFLAEADQGEGVKFPRWTRLWLKYRHPVALEIVAIFVLGYAPKVADLGWGLPRACAC